MSNNYIYNISIVVLIGMVILITLKLLPPVTYSPKGIILYKTKPLSPTQADDIKVYTQNFYGDNDGILAYVNVAENYNSPSEDVKEQLIEYAKQLAASIGARGLVITNIYNNKLTKTYYLASEAVGNANSS